MEITVGDILFVDTNVLLTATDRSRASHIEAVGLIAHAGHCGCHLALSGQVLREYLVVATRPVDVNGLGLSSCQAIANADTFRRYAVFLEESEGTSRRLGDLVARFSLSGKRIHDANIAATMQSHGISQLVTENTGDFDVFGDVITGTVDEVFGAVPGLADGRYG